MKNKNNATVEVAFKEAISIAWRLCDPCGDPQKRLSKISQELEQRLGALDKQTLQEFGPTIQREGLKLLGEAKKAIVWMTEFVTQARTAGMPLTHPVFQMIARVLEALNKICQGPITNLGQFKNPRLRDAEREVNTLAEELLRLTEVRGAQALWKHSLGSKTMLAERLLDGIATRDERKFAYDRVLADELKRPKDREYETVLRDQEICAHVEAYKRLLGIEKSDAAHEDAAKKFNMTAKRVERIVQADRKSLQELKSRCGPAK